jgi:hypothetical protein
MLAKTTRHRVPLPHAALMVFQYARRTIAAQGRAVAFLVVYLVVVLAFVLGSPVSRPGATAAGILAVVVGLAFFLEGLLLGIMPLGEVCGANLPLRLPIVLSLFFAALLGLGATYAEPALVVLRDAGRSVAPWRAPLLYLVLNTHARDLLLSLGAGVGLAVVLSVLRFLYHWSLKPFLVVFVPATLGLTIACALDPQMSTIIGLAWDAGGVATGAVTVPLMIALGIGVAKSSGGQEQGISGLGTVTLAALLPVISALCLAFLVKSEAPAPMGKDAFFALESESAVSRLFASDLDLARLVLRELPAARAVERLGGPEATVATLDRLSLAERTAMLGPGLRALLESRLGPIPPGAAASAGAALAAEARLHATVSLQAVLPLSLFLIVVLVIVLRVRPHRMDEILLGIAFSFIGMMLFNYGVGTGLSRLGYEAGRNVPSVFRAIERPDEATVFRDFDLSRLARAARPDGTEATFFVLNENGRFVPVEFDPGRFDPATRSYTHVPRVGPLVRGGNVGAGIALALLIVFLLGYGVTFAEPALNGLGLKLEDFSVGTLRRSFLIKAVAVGVGIGISVGLARVIWQLPLVWLLVPPYILALVLSLFTNEEYVGIAWDSAGVTTGPITVPLVIALGLGAGAQVGALESFGIVAMASVWPILSVLVALVWLERRRAARHREA